MVQKPPSKSTILYSPGNAKRGICDPDADLLSSTTWSPRYASLLNCNRTPSYREFGALDGTHRRSTHASKSQTPKRASTTRDAPCERTLFTGPLIKETCIISTRLPLGYKKEPKRFAYWHGIWSILTIDRSRSNEPEGHGA